ncbi:hif1an, partial [Symbiodinium pilosum]
DLDRFDCQTSIPHQKSAPSSFIMNKKGTKRGKPNALCKAWGQEVADAASVAMIASRNAEVAAGQAKQYKYFAKSARDASQNALLELEKHFAKDRADASKTRIFFSDCSPAVAVASVAAADRTRHSRASGFL